MIRLSKIKIGMFLCFGIGLLLLPSSAYADSPANLTADINWTDTGGVYDPGSSTFDANFATVADVEAAFNNARRNEETQLGLPANCLGNLSLSATFLSDSADLKALTLLNAERVARSGMCGTDTAVLGYPFEAWEATIDTLAQGYANYVGINNATGHNADGIGPFARIDSDATIGTGACGGVDGHEFINRAENIAYFWTSGTSNPMIVERAVYNWIYNDSGSSWGHREAALLQDEALVVPAGQSGYGFDDNWGAAGQEGFIGVGVYESAAYNPYNYSWSNWGSIVVLKMFDPINATAAGDCGYSFEALAVGMSNVDVDTQSGLTGSLVLVLFGLLVVFTVFARNVQRTK